MTSRVSFSKNHQTISKVYRVYKTEDTAQISDHWKAVMIYIKATVRNLSLYVEALPTASTNQKSTPEPL
jgi:hypothetical protein